MDEIMTWQAFMAQTPTGVVVELAPVHTLPYARYISGCLVLFASDLRFQSKHQRKQPRFYTIRKMRTPNGHLSSPLYITQQGLRL
jgi:hypothetical protein